MRRLAIAMAAMALATIVDPALSQSLDARRMGMGGVVLPFGGSASDANVAYRAVPRASGRSTGLPLPIGLIPLLSDPPTLDPKKPDFNIYELANLLYNPPWNLQLISPDPPSNDVVVNLGRDHLSVQLGDVASLFPDEHSRFADVIHAPQIGFGIKGFFTGPSAIVQYQNDLTLNEPLHAALANGEPFRTRTEYAVLDDVQGQAAAGLQFGWAGRLVDHQNPAEPGGLGLYAGMRARALRGLAYGSADNVVSFTTNDTLFSQAPIELDYAGLTRQCGPSGGRWGRALDLGAVMVRGRLELGIGVNDLASRMNWSVQRDAVARDSVTGDIVTTVVATDEPLTSSFPRVVTANAAFRLGSTLIAADLVNKTGSTLGHAGVEMWLGPLALRTGAGVDSNHDFQIGGGVGVRLGRFGVDAGVTTHHRNLSRERSLELGAGLSLYH